MRAFCNLEELINRLNEYRNENVKRICIVSDESANIIIRPDIGELQPIVIPAMH